MPVLSSDFSTNSLSGAVVVQGNLANINLGRINLFSLEGNKTFYVKLRSGSPTGPVVGITTPIVIPDRSSVISGTANVGVVSEISGNIVSYTVRTANVIGNVILNWQIPNSDNVNRLEFIANTGTVLISNNSGLFTVQIAADKSLIDETGERFQVQIKANSGIVYTDAVIIQDTSKTLTLNSVTSNVNVAIENNIVRFAVNTYNANGTVLYYSTIGSLTNQELNSSNVGSFTPIGISNTTYIDLKLANIIVEPRNFKLQIRTDSTTGNIIYTSSNVLAVLSPPNITVTGTYTAAAVDNFTSYGFTGPGTLTVVSARSSGVPVNYLVVAGGGGGGGININYTSQNAGGAGGVVTGSANLYTGNSFAAIIGAGGASGTQGPGLDSNFATMGGNTILSSSLFSSNIIAVGGGTGRYSVGFDNDAGKGGSGGGGHWPNASFPASENLAYGSPFIGSPNPAINAGAWGVAGPQGYPGGLGGGGGGAGGSSPGNLAVSPGPYSDGRGGIGISFNTSPVFGTPGPGPGRWFAGGGGNRVPVGNPPQNVQGGAGGGGPSWIPDPTGAGLGSNSGYSPRNYQGAGGNVNTGGGGGSGSTGIQPGFNTGGWGGTGGSGIVIIKIQTSGTDIPYTP